MYAILGGLGEQGRAILRYLLINTDEQIITNDLHGKDIPLEMEEMGRKLDPDKKRWTHTAGMFMVGLQQGGFENGVLISCVDPSKNASLAWECIKRKWHYMDLGGDTDVSRTILGYGGTAVQQGVVLASECGLAPGIVSSMAAERIKVVPSGSLLGIHQFCGGIPLHPEPPCSYVRSFSGKGLWREYTGLAEPRINNTIVKYPALSGRESVFVPGFGMLEAFFSSGGQGTATIELDVPTYVYKTLRYHGHLDYVLKYIAHQDDPASFMEDLFPRVSAEYQDAIILIQEITCLRPDGATENITELFFWKYDTKNNVSAMAQATGYAAGALATMIHDGKVAPGGLPMHKVEWPEWRRRIKMMPDQFLTAV